MQRSIAHPRGLRFFVCVEFLLFDLCICAVALAETPGGNTDVRASSPREAVASFQAACESRRYADAAALMDIPEHARKRGPELARRLRAVLDHYVSLDVDSLANAPEGKLDDELPSDVEEITHVVIDNHTPEPVRLARIGAEGRWIFSRRTVQQVDRWFATLPHGWLVEWLPEPLLRIGPAKLAYWQWLTLPLVLFLAWGIGGWLSRVTRGLLKRVAARTRASWDDAMLARVGGPLTLFWVVAIISALLPLLSVAPGAEALLQRVLRVVFLAAVFWMLARGVDIAETLVRTSGWGSAPATGSLVRLGARISKVAVVIFAAIALLSTWGYSVASLLAGLGIGGLAVALAAQKTVENLFGAFSIGVDQPFREGDFVKVEDFVGTVEMIGLRSTRIRTLDRTLITLPNSKLAEMRLESFTARDRIRLACQLGLVYETRAPQLRQILTELERCLRAQSKIWPDAVVVRFVGFGGSSFNIDIMAWFLTTDWNEFQTIRQDLFLEFMAIVENAGSSFALPTQTVHVASLANEAPSNAKLN
ncbi:MAG TPA: mechanosensitive ion channel family protein [Polyangiales bacterium]|nr:mechanosensitive ion channel family protein [Polyangiales bacterium]